MVWHLENPKIIILISVCFLRRTTEIPFMDYLSLFENAFSVFIRNFSTIRYLQQLLVRIRFLKDFLMPYVLCESLKLLPIEFRITLIRFMIRTNTQHLHLENCSDTVLLVVIRLYVLFFFLASSVKYYVRMTLRH